MNRNKVRVRMITIHFHKVHEVKFIEIEMVQPIVWLVGDSLVCNCSGPVPISDLPILVLRP